MPDLHGPLRLVRPEDLLILDFEFVNLALTDDGQRLERADPASPAHVIVHLPSQHVAERAYFEFEDSLEATDPPPVGALAAAPSRLVFSLPAGQSSAPFSVEGLLDWAALVPRLAPNALPPDTSLGPAPAMPAADQTAIELPYRLLLSPDQNARWQHRRAPFVADGRAELWHTRLVADQAPVPLRAVGRRSVPDALRTSLSDRDLDDLVTLSSDFTIRPKSWAELNLPFAHWMEGIQAAGLLGFQYVPRPLEAEQLLLTALGAHARLRGRWDYPGRNQNPNQDVLRSLGMPAPSLEQYEHIAGLGRDQYVRVVRRGFVHPGQPASIVKVTERRFEPRLLEQTPNGPVGIYGTTAYLRQYYKLIIQDPEIAYDKLTGGYDHAGREMPLRSLRLTTLETPKIDLPGGVSPDTYEQQARLEFATHVLQPGEEVAVAREAQRLLEASFTEPFWITVGQRDFEFGYLSADWEGQTITGSMPLVFVPHEAVTDDPSKVLSTFATGDAGRRRRSLGNQRLALADPTGSKPGSTRLPTETLTFSLQAIPPERLPALPVLYRPRWVMAVSGADVHVEAVERLTNSAAAVGMTFDQAYLDGGLAPDANAAGVFAQMASVKVAFGGARGGGLARPDASADRISSRQGALASTFLGRVPPTGPQVPAVTVADLAGLFGGAKLFGTFDLKDILAEISPVTPDHFSHADLPEEAIAALLAAVPSQHLEIPVLRTRPLVRPATPGTPATPANPATPAGPDGQPYAVETRYLWKPRLKEPPKLFLFDDQSELVLEARTVAPLDGSEAKSEVRGELRRFGMSFFGVMQVRMQRLAFVAQAGRKPDVTAEGLDVEFEGPLAFVNTLRDILPANGFSDPPAIEVTPDGISAGYSLGIPTVGVGIFSLQNLALSAALSVPFVDKPAGVRFGIAERHHPFLVTVTLFGGGGFFLVGVSANGVDEIEAAIEFGGNIALNLGVASGGVYVMAGVYFGRTGDVATLTGYLRCGGYLSVLGLISISLEFYLAFTWRDKHNGGSEVWGQASLSVCVQVACFSKSITLSVERRFAGAGGDPSLDQVIEPEDWEQYCLAFAAEEAA